VFLHPGCHNNSGHAYQEVPEGPPDVLPGKIKTQDKIYMVYSISQTGHALRKE